MLNSKKALKAIEAQLSPPLIRLVCQVAETAQKMARLYRVDEEKAYMAGILHDYAKEKPQTEILEIAAENNLLDDVYRQVPYLLHAPVGALLIKAELEIDDEEIIIAISNHTLGRPFMSGLEKIIFLADMIEPDRNFPEVNKLRNLAEKDLDEAMLFGLDSTIKYCLDKKSIIHPQTIIARNYFLAQMARNYYNES